MKRFLDQRPTVVATVFFVGGLAIALGAIAYGFAGERDGVPLYAMFVAAFGGSWVSAEGRRSLRRRQAQRRAAAGA